MHVGPAATGITAANVAKLTRRQVSLDGTVDSSPIYLHGVSVHDWKTGGSDAFSLGAGHLAEEAVFVPRPGGSAEMDGWLAQPSVNLKAKATELHIYDARRVAQGPICTWRADCVLPVSLHGVFVSA